MEEMTKTGCWRLDCKTGKVIWSAQVFAIHDMPVSEEVDLEKALSYYPEESAQRVQDAVARASADGTPYELELDLVSEKGIRKRVRALGEAEIVDGEIVALIGVFQDISEQHRLEKKLRRIATTDELTGLSNRRHLKLYYERRGFGSPAARVPFACALFDLDRFKHLNDSLGHDAGDKAIQTLAERLRDPSLKGSFAARLGGDEFVVLIEDEALLDDLEKTSAALLALVNKSFPYRGQEIDLSATIGIGWFEQKGVALSDVLRCADAALYAAKQHERGSVLIGSPADFMIDGHCARDACSKPTSKAA